MNQIKSFFLTVAAIGTVAFTSQAQLLMFDDLAGTVTNSPSGISGQPVINNFSLGLYDGYQFSAFQCINGAQAGVFAASPNTNQPNGLPNAAVSPNNVILDFNGNTGTINSFTTNGTFGLYSGYFTSAYFDNLDVVVSGWLNGNVVISSTITLVTGSARSYTFATGTSPSIWTVLDQVAFRPQFSGSSASPYGWSSSDPVHNKQFAIDNLQLVPTPEPATWAGLGAVLGGLLLVARSQRKTAVTTGAVSE